jgi:hypothetical protein
MLQNARVPPPDGQRPANGIRIAGFRPVIALTFLLAGVSGCAMFDEYDDYGYDYVYDGAPTHAPAGGYSQAPYGQAPYGHAPAPGRPPCGCSSGSAGSAGMSAPPPAPSSAYQPTGNVVPASASQSREPDLLNR